MKKLLVFMLAAMMMLCGCTSKDAKLAKDMKSPNADVRRKAAVELGDVATSESLRILMLHREDPDSSVRRAVAESLKKIDHRTFLN